MAVPDHSSSIHRGAWIYRQGAAGWETRQLEADGQGMLDGLSVWGRGILRPVGERSMTVIVQRRNARDEVADL